MKQPCYLGLEDARQVLAEMGVKFSLRQMQRAAEQDGQGRRKLPFFIDPIEGKLKIEKDDLLNTYLKTTSGSGKKLTTKLDLLFLKLPFPSGFIALFAMSDIRKRNGSKGISYQVRYPSKAAKTGYAYKSFETMKEARTFARIPLPVGRMARSPAKSARSIKGLQKWLDVCAKEGRNGRDPVTAGTIQNYDIARHHPRVRVDEAAT